MTANKELSTLNLLQINCVGSDHGKFEKRKNDNRGSKTLSLDLSFYICISKNNNNLGDVFRGLYGVFQDALGLGWKGNWTFLALSSSSSGRVDTENLFSDHLPKHMLLWCCTGAPIGQTLLSILHKLGGSGINASLQHKDNLNWIHMIWDLRKQSGKKNTVCQHGIWPLVK